MGFVESLEKIAESSKKNGEFYDAEVLTIYFETKQEVVARLLPSPLKPAQFPLGVAFVANYPKTNFGVTYQESGLSLAAQFNGEEGVYCLAMPVTDDMALILGREVFGYPKKIGEIQLSRNENQVDGWTERHGVRFLEAKANLTGKFNDP
ncbi:MAG: acetoacetate decarboxylase family protein, partial [Deltaproteobacteria bacterium]